MDRSFSPQDFLAALGEELVANFGRAGRATTPGLVGSARENEVRRKLQSFLPPKVGVGTGCIIDSFSSTSNQTDIVLYEKNQTPIFSISDDPNATYFPCESVMAVGEVKSSLGTKELQDAIEKIAGVKSLKRYCTDPTVFRSYGSEGGVQGIPEQALSPENNTLDQIYGFLICHDFSIKQDTLVQRYSDLCKQYPAHLLPNLIVSLQDGLVLFGHNNMVLDSRRGASCIYIAKAVTGEFSYLLNMLATIANQGRTTVRLPYERYLLANPSQPFRSGTSYPL
ncbi:DUF6602 domain-containing protein [Chromobacterium vaccinii]|uniref:DUF6602 domain-containing protein n=1 Tax=Chromobacterium vaccinii TaxID=1108595 RepID=UPI001E2E7744|nr:DUF6602 domain-containing protein [Chromobacterium vaccinii]MCD4501097.1 hypothetical protein [Chromobacterium vaccinii]